MWQISGLYTSTGIIPRPSTPTATFANLLLAGETDGFAIDATGVSATPAYTGAPYAGYVSVKDTGTPANVLSNVNLDSSNLVQSGTSPKMVLWNSAPYVRWTPHNLVLQSQALDSASWVKAANWSATADATTAPDGTSTADRINVNITGSGDYCRQQVTLIAGVPYTASAYVKKGTGDYVYFGISDFTANALDYYFNINSGTIGTQSLAGDATDLGKSITSVGSGWYRITVSVSFAASHTFYMEIDSRDADNSATATSGNQLYAWGAQLVRGYDANPYLVTTAAARIGIPQEYDTAASKYGILVEPAATNVLLRSEDFATTWVTSALTVTSDTDTAPDGSTTADTLTATGNGLISQQVSLTQGNVALSFFAKAGDVDWIRTGAWDGVANGAVKFFNINTGSLGTTADFGTGWSTVSATITSVGNGWYRCVHIISTGNTSPYCFCNPTSADNTAGANGNDIRVWGAQAEVGTITTSYIPTLGSTVTRAADVIKAAKTTFPWSDTNGSIYAKYKPFNVGSGSRYVWQAYKDANNHISLVGVTADPDLENTQASTQDVLLDAGTLVANTLTRVSGAYKANDFDVSQDGGAVQSDGASTLTTGYTDLYIGTKGSATTEELSGYIYHLLYVPYQRQTVNGDIDTWKNSA